MVTFTLPGIDRKFDAVELRRVGDAVHPIVTSDTLSEVVASLGRKRVWVGRAMAVEAKGVTGHVIEVLRPDAAGHYDLCSISWLGQMPGSPETNRRPSPRTESGPPATRARA